MAVTWVSVAVTGLAVIVALGGLAWGRHVIREAKEDAKQEAERLIAKWLRDEAPKIIREGADGIRASSLDFGDTLENAADQVGRAAG